MKATRPETEYMCMYSSVLGQVKRGEKVGSRMENSSCRVPQYMQARALVMEVLYNGVKWCRMGASSSV